ncbi:TPA: hypothetical protein ACX6SS_002229 [Photobacterium damselae]
MPINDKKCEQERKLVQRMRDRRTAQGITQNVNRRYLMNTIYQTKYGLVDVSKSNNFLLSDYKIMTLLPNLKDGLGISKYCPLDMAITQEIAEEFAAEVITFIS